ncbi:hypothetical protein JX266_006682 [Neoarthrinium moseri]|nr:hypothetical protein JX266_006682 [Neoarthrinium moseri]
MLLRRAALAGRSKHQASLAVSQERHMVCREPSSETWCGGESGSGFSYMKYYILPQDCIHLGDHGNVDSVFWSSRGIVASSRDLLERRYGGQDYLACNERVFPVFTGPRFATMPGPWVKYNGEASLVRDSKDNIRLRSSQQQQQYIHISSRSRGGLSVDETLHILTYLVQSDQGLATCSGSQGAWVAGWLVQGRHLL